MQRFICNVILATDRHNVPYEGDLIRLQPDAPGRKLTSLAGAGLGYEEAEFVVDGADDVVIPHNDAGGDPENRFYMGDGLDRTLTPGIAWYATYHPTGLTTALGNFGPGWYGAEPL